VHGNANPTLQLAHFLRILGPSALTLYKHVLCRRRILIYTQPPVEAACVLCQIAADMCFEDQIAVESSEGAPLRPRQRGKQKGGINVLGIITLHDINFLEQESNTGRGWIACTFSVPWPLIPFLPAHGSRQVRLTPCSWKNRSTTTSSLT
jgi:DENN domain-containing protein 11